MALLASYSRAGVLSFFPSILMAVRKSLCELQGYKNEDDEQLVLSHSC